MKIFATNRSRLVALLAFSVLLCVGSAVWLGVRVYEVSEYFGGDGDQPTAAPQGTDADAPDDGEKKPAPPEEAGDPPPPKTVETKEFPIRPTVTGELPVTTPREEGVVRLTTVDLPPEASTWAEVGKQPDIGDVIRITIPPSGDSPGREYLVVVESFEIEGDCTHLLGSLKGLLGSCTMLAREGKITVKLVDLTNTRTYNIFYHKNKKTYTVEEVDPSRIPESIDRVAT